MMIYSINKRSKHFRKFFVTLLVMCLAGCQIFVTQSAPPTDCIVPSLEGLPVESKGRVFYILISGKASYQEYRQKISKDILPKVLNNVLSPNDTVIVSWMEADAGSTIEDSVPFMAVVEPIATPLIFQIATPQLTPTYTPDPGLIPGPKKDRVQEEGESIDAANREILVNYNCQTAAPYVQTQQSIIDAAKSAQHQKISDVIAGVQSTVDSGTGYQEGAQEALDLASDITEDMCSKSDYYSECIVLIFSDIEGANALKGISFNFSHSHLGIVLLNCDFWVNRCGDVKDEIYTQTHFYQSICFISSQSPVVFLEDYVRSKRCK